MHILEHAPVTLFSGFSKSEIGILFLTLTHGDIGKGSCLNRFVVSMTNLLDIRSWVNTWEKHEESRNSGFCLSVKLKHVEGWLFNVFDSKPLTDVLDKSTSKSIRSHCSEKQ